MTYISIFGDNTPKKIIDKNDVVGLECFNAISKIADGRNRADIVPVLLRISEAKNLAEFKSLVSIFDRNIGRNHRRTMDFAEHLNNRSEVPQLGTCLEYVIEKSNVGQKLLCALSDYVRAVEDIRNKHSDREKWKREQNFSQNWSSFVHDATKDQKIALTEASSAFFDPNNDQGEKFIGNMVKRMTQNAFNALKKA